MKRTDEDNLFESTKMTFGEHLEELRVALFKSLLALVLGCVVGLLIGHWVVDRIKQPLKRGLQEHYRKIDEQEQLDLIERLKSEGKSVDEVIDDLPSDEPMSLEQIYVNPHELLQELKKIFPDELPEIPDGMGQESMVPIIVARPKKLDEQSQIISTNVMEAFVVYIKAALVTGAVVASPFIFYFIWTFVAAGLYPRERHYVYTFMPFSLFLFLAGAALAFFVVFKYVLAFLFSFNEWLGISPLPKINEWLSFVLFLPLGFGFSFQLPLVMLFLERIGIFTVQSYLEKWRVAVFVISVLSMLLTPSDPQSMILMFIPLTVLYFGGILLCRIWPRPQSPFGESVS